MIIWLDIEIWVIGKGGTKKGAGNRGGCVAVVYGCLWVLLPLCMFWCISVVVEGAYVRNYRWLGLCTVGTVS
jgi:hypothetical protein